MKSNTDYKTWWKGLNEEEKYKLCCKHFQGIPVESLMDKSILAMYHYENPITTETTTNTLTGGEWEVSNESEPDLTIWAKSKISESTIQNECVATVWATSNTEANANRIVKCVNNFDSLVSALKNLHESILSLDSNTLPTSWWINNKETVAKAKEVLNNIK